MLLRNKMKLHVMRLYITCRKIVRSGAILSDIEIFGEFVSRSESEHGIVIETIISEQQASSGLHHLQQFI